MMVGRSIASAIFVLVVAGCVHPGSNRRGPASEDAQAWKREGLCAILHKNFPVDSQTSAMGREAHVAIDDVSGRQFLTVTPEACRRLKYRVRVKAKGVVQDLPAVNECEVYGGTIITPAPKHTEGLVEVYRWTDPATKMTFNALVTAKCEDQGFTRSLDPLGLGNP